MEIWEATAKWNTDRGNPRGVINYDLEYDMLLEEVNEFKSATTDVDRLDATLDLIFVAIGTLHKLGLYPAQKVDALQIVLDANKQKSATKSADGKITKPTDFQPPEPKLQLILNKRSK